MPHGLDFSGSTSKIFRSKRAPEARLAAERKEAESGSRSGSEGEGRFRACQCGKTVLRVRFA